MFHSASHRPLVTTMLFGRNKLLPTQHFAFATGGKDWAFPKHKELLNDDFYQPDEATDN